MCLKPHVSNVSESSKRRRSSRELLMVQKQIGPTRAFYLHRAYRSSTLRLALAICTQLNGDQPPSLTNPLHHLLQPLDVINRSA